MAAITNDNSASYEAAYVTKPSVKLDVTLEKGRVRRAFAVYTIPTADEIGTDSLIKMFKLPIGARVVDARFKATDDLTSGIVVVGWDSGEDGLETADADGFFGGTELDFGNADIDAKMLATANAWNRKFIDTVTVILDGTEASNASGDNTLELEVLYTLD